LFLSQTQIEVVNEQIPRGAFRFVLFDFDGTISLIREGWQQVMIPMMVGVLAECPKAETPEALEQLVAAYVARSTGIQTVYQMQWLSDQVSQRCGKPLEPLIYKDIYNQKLNARIRQRIEDLRAGRANPNDWMVPGARQTLEHLRQLGCTLICASGTDHQYVTSEAELLGMAGFFNGGLYGATNDYKNFSKKILIERIIKDHRLAGADFLTFGDGYVEIEDTKAVQGVAVGVASDEVSRQGIDSAKRARLIQAGADVIIPDFRQQDALLKWLFPERQT
jgi:phosphoglycolate phosphatase